MAEYRAEGQELRLLPQDLHDQDPAAGAVVAVHLANNKFSHVPLRLLEHAALRRLDLSNNDISEVPHTIVRLAQLEDLSLAANVLKSIPVELFQLSALTALNLSRNRLSHLLPYIGLLSSLASVDLSHNELGSLPSEFALLTALTSLNVSHNRLSHLPLGETPQLVHLNLRRNLFSSLPTIRSAHLASLDAAHNELYVFPEPLPASLRVLDLSNNLISSTPDSLATVTSLERFYMDENRLSDVPSALEALTNLVEFSFRGNRITSVSPVIEAHPAAFRAFEDNPRLVDVETPPPLLHHATLLKPRSLDALTKELATVAQQHARFEFEYRLRQRELQIHNLEAERKKIDELAKKIDSIGSGGGGIGLSGSTRIVNSPGQSLENLKKEIEELQKIVFSDTASVKEVNDANIKLEKAMAAFEKHPESKEAVKKAKEEQRARNDPLNKEALERLRQVLNPNTVRSNPELLKRVGENAELRLLFMEPETILRLHPNDFKTYTLKNVTLEEMRAIRACLPKFRKDQHVQQEWTDNLDDKIETAVRTALAPPAPKRQPRKIVLKKPAAGASASGGDVFAELLARKGSGLTPRPASMNTIPALSPPVSPRGAHVAPVSAPVAVPASLARPGALAPPISISTSSPSTSPAPASPLAAAAAAAAAPRPVSTSALTPLRVPMRPASPVGTRPASPMAKRSAVSTLSAVTDNVKAAFDDDAPPMPSGGNPRASQTAANVAAAAAAAVAAAAGIPSASLLQQYEALDALLNKLLEFSTKGDADIAADTRATVAELKKLAEMCRIHNPDAVGPLDSTSADLVAAVKSLLVSRNPVARVSLGADMMTVEQAKEHLEDVVMQIREKAANAIMQ